MFSIVISEVHFKINFLQLLLTASAQNTPRTDSFSNSWPESAKIFDDASKSNKKKLDPITGEKASRL